VGIFAQIKNSVNTILPRLFSDEDMVTLVVWKKFKDSAFDDTEGVNVDTYTDFKDVPAIKVEKEIGSRNPGMTFPPGPWSISSGDIVYLFQDKDVPSGASIRDLVIDGSITYSVKKIFPVFGLIVKVEVEGYA